MKCAIIALLGLLRVNMQVLCNFSQAVESVCGALSVLHYLFYPYNISVKQFSCYKMYREVMLK
jgi:hypothetical protein